MSNTAQRSFAGGEIAPSLYGATNTARYQTALRQMRNMMIQQHGGAINRPGLPFIAEIKNSSKQCRMIKFVKNNTITNTYMLELGDGYVRFYQNGVRLSIAAPAAWVDTTVYAYGATVSQGGVNYVCIVAHTAATGTNKPGVDTNAPTFWYALTGLIYEIPTPYAVTDLGDIQLQQSGEVITLVHPGYAPRELTRISQTNWQLTTISFGPSIAAPTGLALAGGAAGAITYWAVTAIKEGTYEESLPTFISTTTKVPAAGTPTTITWNPVVGAISYNVYRSTDGATYGLIGPAGGATVPATSTVFVTNDITATGSTPGTFTAAAGQLRWNVIAAKADKAYDGNYTIDGEVTIVTGPTGGTYRIAAYYSRDGETRQLFGYILSPYFSAGVGTVKIYGPFTVNVPDNGYTTLTLDFVPEANPSSGTGSIQFNTATAPHNVVSWSKSVTGLSDSATSVDRTVAPPSNPNRFASAGNFPSAIARYQQRMIYGNSINEQGRIWASRTGSRRSFASSKPVGANDPIQFEIDSKQANAVRHLLDLARLIVFTDAAEHIVEGETQTGILKPDALNTRSHSYNGAAKLPPIVINNRALYVQARSNSVRTIRHDDVEGSINVNLSLYASHLFQNKTLVDWDFALTPNSVLWVVRSDGVLLGLTYLPEQEVWGWHRHDTDGFFENVCVVPEGNEDTVYVVVRRTINGVTKRYVEKMAPRYVDDQRDSWFVDAGIRIDGTNTGTTSMTLSTGASWTSNDLLTISASAAYFSAADVGDSMWFTAADGTQIEVMIENYTDNQHVTGHPKATIPAYLQNVAKTNWVRATKKVTGLSHLEGKSVSVFADGFVVSSPNNVTGNYPTVVVTGGVATLPRPYRKILVGLPFISDTELLDIDAPGPVTVKNRRRLVSTVTIFFEKTRGVWVGQSNQPTAANPVFGLEELKLRELEGYADPVSLLTDSAVLTPQSQWNTNGRVLIRQVDPLPISILMVSPELADAS